MAVSTASLPVVGVTIARAKAPQPLDDLERGDGNAQVFQEEKPHSLPE